MNNREKVLELYFICRLKQVDIAEKLGITSSAVSQILRGDIRFVEEKNRRKSENRTKHIENTKKIIKRQREKKNLKKIRMI